MNKYYLLLALIALALLYRYGRTFYSPLLSKIKGKETIESRVTALEGKVYRSLASRLEELGLTSFPDNITIIAFKKEQRLEVYTSQADGYHLIKTYTFTATSGQLGPKLKEGDRQIPEGIYKLEYLNPNSSYYLSMKINYPNEYDKQKAKVDNRERLGYDIFIHGKAQTIGCIPIGDEAIEELFVMASKAWNKEIRVIITPAENFSGLSTEGISWSEELYGLIREELGKVR